MKKLVIITWTTMMVMFGLTGIAQADENTGPYVIMNAAAEIGPFVSISATSDTVEFGETEFSDTFGIPGQVWFPSLYRSSSAALTVHVESNCLHGPIVASVTALKHSGGSTITPDRIFIKAPAITGEYSSMARPVPISETQTGSHDIELIFKLQSKLFDRAGRYTGTITFTVMPPTR
jgi:hypothetical protein